MTSSRRWLGDALLGMLNWRLLLLWVLALLLPTLVVWLPLSALLGHALDWSPRAAVLAHQFDLVAFEDIGVLFSRSGAAMGAVSMVALLFALLLSPFLAGMVAAAQRAERPLGFLGLVGGAIAWYGRMFRMLLVSLPLFGVVGGLSAVAFKIATARAQSAILESQADHARQAALLVTTALFVLVHATLEAGRAQLAADERLRSGWRAWWRGVQLTVRRPLAVLGLYLGVTLATLVPALLLLMVRLRLVGANAPLFWLAFLVTQLAVAAIAWGRAARLAALTMFCRG